jgi:putative Holliday junction resolvase
MTDNKANKPETENRSGRFMALDLGEKRIGVALSDESKQLARSHGNINRSSRAADFSAIGRIVTEQNVALIVVGLPTLSSGEEGSKAAWVRDYSQDLSQKLQIQVVVWDESYSTVDAELSMRARKMSRSQRRMRVDEVAAAFILQSYLDEH